MNVLYMGKNKTSTILGLKYLISKKINITAVIAPKTKDKNSLYSTAKSYGIPIIPDDKLYQYISNEKKRKKYSLDNIDLVISFLFWKKIKKPLIILSKIGCINFHPAPLPEFRGVCGYNFALYENMNYWGVSAHFVDENFDTGEIIKVKKFKINSQNETAFSLEAKSQLVLLELFKEIIVLFKKNKIVLRIHQKKGRYISKKDFENVRTVKRTDTLDEIERKIKAFWSPPYHGAAIKIKGREYTIINEYLLREIGTLYKNHFSINTSKLKRK